MYHARDTVLGREVAIKVSFSQFTARFKREAGVIASLNHPNICTLFEAGPDYLVMELVEGPTLADRLKSGPIPVDEALEIARQIAAALEAAHEKPVIHRDLKPANIKIRPDGLVKVLDFGLAKNREPDPDNDATVTMGMSVAGTIMGTPAYMSPEQARGLDVDRRSDIWAYGVLLYEMTTGKRLFDGPTITDILASVVAKDVSFEDAPAKVRRLLRICVEKDPKRRLRDIGEAWRHIGEEAAVQIAAAPPAERSWIWPSAAVLATLAAGALAYIHFQETPLPAPQAVRFSVPALPQAGSDLFVSPDGHSVASWSSDVNGRYVLAVRSLQETEWRTISGSESVSNSPPFWTSDSRAIIFGTGGQIKKVAVAGGGAILLANAEGVISGDQRDDGTLLIGTPNGVLRLSAQGGTPVEVTKSFRAKTNAVHAFPQFLPDQRHFIYRKTSAVPEIAGTYLGDVEATPESQTDERIVPGYAFFRDGYLLFPQADILVAQRFDPEHRKLLGTAQLIEGNVRITSAAFSASRNGVLAYRAGSGEARQLIWYERTGKVLSTLGPAGAMVSLSPDGERMVVERTVRGKLGFWLEDLKLRVPDLLVSGFPRLTNALFHSGGSRIAFSAGTQLDMDLYQISAQGGSTPELLLKAEDSQWALDVSPDQKALLYGHGQLVLDLWTLSLEERKAKPYLQTPHREAQAQFSLDGRYVAYISDETGIYEVYVSAYPDPSVGRWTISQGGGLEPHWSPDGRELLYVAGQKLVSVPVKTSPSFQREQARTLFEGAFETDTNSRHRWQIHPDGKRFLMTVRSADQQAAPLTVILNWPSLIKPK